MVSLVGLFWGCVENCADGGGAEEFCASISESAALENPEADFCAITEAPAAVAPPEHFAQTDFVRLTEYAPKLSARKNLSAIISNQTSARHFKPPFQILRQLRI